MLFTPVITLTFLSYLEGKDYQDSSHGCTQALTSFVELDSCTDYVMYLCNDTEPCKVVLCPVPTRGLGTLTPTQIF